MSGAPRRRSAAGGPGGLPAWGLTAGIALLIAVVGVAATQGAYDVGWRELWRLDETGGQAHPGALVFWHIRAPRLFMGLMAGAALGAAGALAQGLFRNPLADPGLIGVSSGAALGAGLAIVLGGSLAVPWGAWPLMGGAFLGGLLATALAWSLARRDGQVRVTLLLLVGVAINAMCGAGLGLLSHLATDDQLRSLTFWLLGSLGGSQWKPALACAAVVIPTVVIGMSQARALDALALGEAQARLLGVDLWRVQRRCVALVALAVGAVTALTGMVGFVGLLAPHVARLLLGPAHRRVIPASAACGAVLVLLADTAARTWVVPQELPLGVLTGLIGAPAFVWMLRGRLQSR